MKTQNRIILYILALLACSCQDDFLTQDPQTRFSTRQVFSSLDNVQAFNFGIYYKWRDTRVNRKAFYSMLGTDEAQLGEYQMRTEALSAAFDRFDGYYDSENSAVAELWNARWPAAVQASEGLYYLSQMEGGASEEDLSRIQFFTGQLAFYRAAILFELTQYWGKIPLPDMVNGENQLGPRQELSKVYEFIEKDLKKAIEYLPEKRPVDGRIPTTWAATMLYAKVYMSAPVESGYRNYTEAKIWLQEMKDRSGFNLEINYANLFDVYKTGGYSPQGGVYSPEEVFTFYFNSVYPDCSYAQWFAGSRACSSDPNCMLGGYDVILPTPYCVNIYETGDLRKEVNLRSNFIYKGRQPTPTAGFGNDQTKPHFKKFEDARIDGVKSFFYTGVNQYYLRYADALLMLAECMARTGDVLGAIDLVNNTVRKRAFGGILPEENKWLNMSADEFIVKLMDERMRELPAEGWRRMDLVRTGFFTQYVKIRNQWASQSGMIGEQHQLFPIPMVEMKQNPFINPDMDQNPGLK